MPRRSAYSPDRPVQDCSAQARARSAIPPKADVRSTLPLRYHISSSAGMPNVLRRSNVVDSNFRPNSRARRQDIFSSVRDGRRAISAYLSRYLVLAESQKLSGWNCAITFTGASGTCSAIQSSTGYVQHSTWLGITKWRIEKSSPHSAMRSRFLVTVSQYQGVFASAIAHRPGPNLKSGSQTSVRTRRIFMLLSVIKKLLFHSIGALNLPS